MPETAKEILALADRLYEGREDLDGVRRSLELLHVAGGDYETLWRMARASFFMGQESKDDSEARAHYLSGIDAGGRAVKVSDSGIEGHFWLGVNLALLAQIKNPLAALQLALHAKRELKRAAALNPSYHAAGPLRVLARLESKLPRLFGGSHKRALLLFEEALRLAPSNTVTRLYFAELLRDLGEMTRARAELEVILATPLDPAWAFEIRRDKTRAREMLRTQK